MLVANCLLHGVTRRTFGRTAAVFAASLFAGVGATQYLGAFVTSSALALAALAAATWLGVHAVMRRRVSLLMLTACGVMLAFANATEYSAAAFDPVVVLILFWCGRHQSGARAASSAATTVSLASLGTLGIAASAGHDFRHSLIVTVMSHLIAGAPPSGLLTLSLDWAGGVALLAVIGAATAATRGRAYGWLGATLALAVLIAPAEQARVGPIGRLISYAGFGEWFGCVVAGLALASIAAAVPAVKAEGALRTAWSAVAVSSVAGCWLTAGQFAAAPSPAALARELRPLLASSGSISATAGIAASSAGLIRGPITRGYALDVLPEGRMVPGGCAFYAGGGGVEEAVGNLERYRLQLTRSYRGLMPARRSPERAYRVASYSAPPGRICRLIGSIPYTVGGKHVTYRVWVYGGSR